MPTTIFVGINLWILTSGERLGARPTELKALPIL
ncbi:hypothetical protein BIW11_04422 [Tropilaelaps mercedesae]|uniref:Uncharacterized protein n=1 Tax=Tropilaelaps mercedesae TaxID=418985 RepID=A0A1V9X7D1_9ACAR|nr:hypothetical protein BIW11_04422 [Tropilaelaps mercedesae]